jgi:hypothetical protein
LTASIKFADCPGHKGPIILHHLTLLKHCDYPILTVTLCVMFFPILGFTALNGSSMAQGLLFAAAVAILVFLDDARKSLLVIGAVCVGLAFLVSAHALAAWSITDSFWFARFAIGLAGFVLCLYAAIIVGRRLSETDQTTIGIIVAVCLAVLLVNAALPLIGINLGLDTTAKPAGIYYEPSHLVVSATPFLLFLSLRVRPVVALPVLSAFLAWAIIYKSLIGIVVCLTILLLGLRWRLAYVMFLAVGGAVAAALIDWSYVLPRVSLSVENGNATTWVMLQGWENAVFSLKETYGIGVGFQQFGTLISDGPANQALAAMNRQAGNLLDGGSTATKLIGEFGAFGIVMVVAATSLAAVAAFRCRFWNVSPSVALLYCALAALPVELFLRGMGYFSPTIFLATAGIVAIASDRSKPQTLPAQFSRV